jgi:hypothetical protein
MSERILTQDGIFFTIDNRIMISKTINVIPATTAHYRADSCVVDGSNFVSQWNDLSGNGYHALQELQTSKPLLVAGGLNSKPVLKFNGENFMIANFGKTLSQPNTMYIVLNITGTNTSQYFFDGIAINFRNYIGFLPLSTGFTINSGSNIYYPTTKLPPMIYTIWNTVYRGTNSIVRENNIQVMSGNTGTNGLTGLTIGASRGGGASYITGNIAELIYYNKVLSAYQNTQVINYLNNRYAII